MSLCMTKDLGVLKTKEKSGSVSPLLSKYRASEPFDGWKVVCFSLPNFRAFGFKRLDLQGRMVWFEVVYTGPIIDLDLLTSLMKWIQHNSILTEIETGS